MHKIFGPVLETSGVINKSNLLRKSKCSKNVRCFIFTSSKLLLCLKLTMFITPCLRSGDLYAMYVFITLGKIKNEMTDFPGRYLVERNV